MKVPHPKWMQVCKNKHPPNDKIPRADTPRFDYSERMESVREAFLYLDDNIHLISYSRWIYSWRHHGRIATPLFLDGVRGLYFSNEHFSRCSRQMLPIPKHVEKYDICQS
jgi:hypothetical protein